MTATPLPPDDVIARATSIVRGAYLELPTLHLTRSQIQRLWGLDARSASLVLEDLLALGFLERAVDGGFVRVRRSVTRKPADINFALEHTRGSERAMSTMIEPPR